MHKNGQCEVKLRADREREPRHACGYARNQGGHVADARHKTGDHVPRQRATVQGAGLFDDGPDAVRTDDAPDEERDACNRHDDSLEREEVTAVCIRCE